MKIVKMPYSAGAWRLLNDEGQEVYWSRPMDHSDLGKTIVTMPVCGDTKAECLANTLELLSLAMKRVRELMNTQS